MTIVFPRLAAVKDSDGGEMKARMKSLWDNCKETVKGFAEIFFRLVRRGGGGPAHDGARNARAHRPDGGLFPPVQRGKNGGGILLTSPIRSTRPSAFSSERTARRQSLRASSARYREIMVDEYQDTNEVQNRIFDAISCKGENLFTVGDVKQSIYRFRLADPRIFFAAL